MYDIPRRKIVERQGKYYVIEFNGYDEFRKEYDIDVYCENEYRYVDEKDRVYINIISDFRKDEIDKIEIENKLIGNFDKTTY